MDVKQKALIKNVSKEKDELIENGIQPLKLTKLEANCHTISLKIILYWLKLLLT